jgi:hypothetical protein
MHAREHGDGLSDGFHAAGGDAKESLGSSTSPGRRVADLRGQQAFLFEPLERDVHGATRDLATGAMFDLVANRRSVCVGAKVKNGHEDDDFELAERTGWSHAYNVDNRVAVVNAPDRGQRQNRRRIYAMPEWLDVTLRIVVSAAIIVLLFKYRGRQWLSKWRSHV